MNWMTPPKLKTISGEEISVGRFLKLYCAAVGLVIFASLYLLACVWVGTDYSYTGGWFMFLSVFFMPIRFKERKNAIHA